MRLEFLRLQIFECYTPVTWYLASPLCTSVCACIVGAVADGAIIESGSNSNGYWVRLADGTQVCRFVTPVIGTTPGQFSTTCTFPVQFISLPEVFGFNDIYIAPTTSFETVQAMLWGVINMTITTTSCQISCIAFNITPSNRAGKFLAIGRWKA